MNFTLIKVKYLLLKNKNVISMRKLYNIMIICETKQFLSGIYLKTNSKHQILIATLYSAVKTSRDGIKKK